MSREIKRNREENTKKKNTKKQIPQKFEERKNQIRTSVTA